MYLGDIAYEFWLDKYYCSDCISYCEGNPRIKCNDCSKVITCDDTFFIDGTPYCEDCVDKRKIIIGG